MRLRWISRAYLRNSTESSVRVAMPESRRMRDMRWRRTSSSGSSALRRSRSSISGPLRIWGIAYRVATAAADGFSCGTLEVLEEEESGGVVEEEIEEEERE